jgi:hypothetical protein
LYFLCDSRPFRSLSWLLMAAASRLSSSMRPARVPYAWAYPLAAHALSHVATSFARTALQSTCRPSRRHGTRHPLARSAVPRWTKTRVKYRHLPCALVANWAISACETLSSAMISTLATCAQCPSRRQSGGSDVSSATGTFATRAVRVLGPAVLQRRSKNTRGLDRSEARRAASGSGL